MISLKRFYKYGNKMSLDSKYIIQYEGPFGKTELEEQLEQLNGLPNSHGFQHLGYDYIFGETKWSADEEIIEIAKKSTPIQILKSQDTFWNEIYNIRNK